MIKRIKDILWEKKKFTTYSVRFAKSRRSCPNWGTTERQWESANLI